MPLQVKSSTQKEKIVAAASQLFARQGYHGTSFYNGIPANYSQWDLAFPYQNSPTFYESIWNAALITITFGTDSSLTTGPGWDNTTGVGTPNGAAFIAPY